MRRISNFFYLIVFAVASGVLIGCATRNDIVRLSSPSASPEAVFMTNDANGNPVVVWLESDTIFHEGHFWHSFSV